MLNVFEKYLKLLLGAELSFIVLDSFPQLLIVYFFSSSTGKNVVCL